MQFVLFSSYKRENMNCNVSQTIRLNLVCLVLLDLVMIKQWKEVSTLCII